MPTLFAESDGSFTVDGHPDVLVRPDLDGFYVALVGVAGREDVSIQTWPTADQAVRALDAGLVSWESNR